MQFRSGNLDQTREAVSMLLAKVAEDPQSASCPNISYADVPGPVASAYPTGSPYAIVPPPNAQHSAPGGAPGVGLGQTGINAGVAQLGFPPGPAASTLGGVSFASVGLGPPHPGDLYASLGAQTQGVGGANTSGVGPGHNPLSGFSGGPVSGCLGGANAPGSSGANALAVAVSAAMNAAVAVSRAAPLSNNSSSAIASQNAGSGPQGALQTAAAAAAAAASRAFTVSGVNSGISHCRTSHGLHPISQSHHPHSHSHNQHQQQSAFGLLGAATSGGGSPLGGLNDYTGTGLGNQACSPTASSATSSSAATNLSLDVMRKVLRAAQYSEQATEDIANAMHVLSLYGFISMSSLMGAGASNSPLNASTTSTSTGLGTQTLCGSGGNLGAMGALGSSTGLRNSVPTTSPQGGDSSSDCTGSSFVGSSGHFGHSNNYPSGSGGSESGTTTGGHSFYTTSQSVGAATAFPSALRPTGFRLRASSGNVGCSGGESTTNGGTDGYKSSHPPLHSSGQTSFGGPPIDLVTTPPAQQQLMSISNISTSPTRQVLSIPSPGGTIQAAALSASTPSQLCLQANSSIALPLINASKGNISINGGNDSSKTGSSGDILDSQLPSELVASSVGCPSQTDG